MLPPPIIPDLITKPLVWSSTLPYTHAPRSLRAKAGQGSDCPGLLDKGKYLQWSGNEESAIHMLEWAFPSSHSGSSSEQFPGRWPSMTMLANENKRVRVRAHVKPNTPPASSIAFCGSRTSTSSLPCTWRKTSSASNVAEGPWRPAERWDSISPAHTSGNVQPCAPVPPRDHQQWFLQLLSLNNPCIMCSLLEQHSRFHCKRNGLKQNTLYQQHNRITGQLVSSWIDW